MSRSPRRRTSGLTSFGVAVTGHDGFVVDPWQLREVGVNLEVLAQSESLFALSNGHVGVRGNLDEGSPHGLPGTYLNSFYETRPLPYAEAGYGYPETGQTVVNVTDGKLIRLLVDDEPFDVRYGHCPRHERTLDLRSGVLERRVEWVTPSAKAIRIRSRRMVSLTHRGIMAISYEVEPVREPMRVVVQSELVANQEMPSMPDDPRVAAALQEPLEPLCHEGTGMRAVLGHRTRASRQRLVAAMDHVVEGTEHPIELDVHEDWARVTVNERLEPGRCLRLTKWVAYGWSGQRSLPALRDQAEAALTSARSAGWDGLLAEQRGRLDEFWDTADIEVDGDPVVQQAVRFALFHLMQASMRAERRAIPAKGLTGPGYDGHAFWDTEAFVLPVLTATVPHAAADALRWRHATAEDACQRASVLGWRGAAFPWRTIRGQECSGYWPAGAAALHINADIAAAAVQYVHWTGDTEFDRDHALPLLVETARLWHSVGYHGMDGAFHIDGVTGPDEYSALSDDNAYTNLMAAANLRAAADCVERHVTDVAADEVAAWRQDAAAMLVPRAEDGIPEQARGYNSRETWDFARTDAEGGYPLLLHSHYMELYRKQVVKQADLMLAMHLFGDQFTFEEKARAFAYYEPLTVRDSSLSACTQAVIAAEVGHLDLAYEYLTEAALMDLSDVEHNTRDGLHIASLAGGWIALVAGLGGMRERNGQLSFAPQLPDRITGLRFALRWQGARVRVAVSPHQVTYTLDDAVQAVQLRHCEEVLVLQAGSAISRPVRRVRPLTPRPQQPAGRAPQSPR